MAGSCTGSRTSRGSRRIGFASPGRPRRHLEDLKHGRKRGLIWQPRAAQHRVGFYPRFLRHSKGEWARRPVELNGWQKFVIGSVFGWKRADGTRRFRYVYEEVPRKNGKHTRGSRPLLKAAGYASD